MKKLEDAGDKGDRGAWGQTKRADKRQTGGQRGRQRDKHTSSKTDRHADRETSDTTYIQIERPMYRQRQRGRRTRNQRGKTAMTDRQTDTQDKGDSRN